MTEFICRAMGELRTAMRSWPNASLAR